MTADSGAVTFESPTSFEATPLRVLIVDDDEVDRMAVRRGFLRSGVSVALTEAHDEVTARRLLHERDFDCVILDYNIPGSDGLRLLETLRLERPGTPVIMLTGQGDEQVAVRLMKAGAVDYLPKTSVTPERLASSLRYAVEITRASLMARLAAEELRDSAARSRFLAEASAVLTRSLDPRETIGEVARLCVPFLADCCLVYRIQRNGDLALVAAAHHDPALQHAARVIARIDAPVRGGPVAAAVGSRQVVVVDDVSDDLLTTMSGSEEVLDAFRRIAPERIAVLPTIAAQRVRGAIAFGRAAGRSAFSPADLEVAEDLARRTALAFDNAGLYEAAERARARTERLQQVTANLARVLPRGDVANLLVREVRDALGAETAWVAGLSPDGQELRALAQTGFEPREIERWLHLPVDAPTPARDVMRDGIDRWFGSRAALVAEYPALGERLASLRQEALGVLALDAGEARLGVLTVGFRKVREIAEEERALARALASQCAQALERARLYDAEREARQHAELANRAKSEFLARMSHDLRTPLNAIGGYADLVQLGIRGPVTSEQQEAMERIKRAKDHLLTLINDILSFAKLEAGQVTIQLEPVDVPEVAGELRPLIEPQIAAKGLQWEERGTAALRVRADRERLVQVLLNLLTNALKFTEVGTITLAWEQHGDEVLIHVSDTGCGIAQERLSSIFDPFIQAGTSQTEEREGVGLGLAITRELVRLMGGDVSVRSVLGGGSTFTVVLPAV